MPGSRTFRHLPPQELNVLDDPLWVHLPEVHSWELSSPPILREDSLPDHLPLMPLLEAGDLRPPQISSWIWYLERLTVETG